MKEIVTGWQAREANGAQTLNDHTDAAYDADVLAGLTALPVDADAWLTPLVGNLARLASYHARLEGAAAQATGGDGRSVASPRVASHHSA
jgi:pyruvate,orthophosphate dikinase